MFKALTTAATGMVAQQTQIDVTANNMANVNTVGFRRSRAEFEDLLYQNVRAPGGSTANGGPMPTGIQVGSGTRVVSTELLHTQGSTMQTGNPLDLAIEGSGFFQILQPNGEMAYTRAGNLKVDPEGRLVTVDGNSVEPALSLPTDATSITFAPDGTISVTTPGQSTAQDVGQLQLANFANPAGLQALGGGLFSATSASGEALVASPGQDGIGTLMQGALEGSNVEVVNEMIDLISSQRAYEINHRVIQAADEMLRKTTER